MRIPYISDPIRTASESDAAIVQRVRTRRGAAGLLLLDRVLLHAPPVSDGWNYFLGSIRQRTTLSTDIQELAISRVALLNRAHYEWTHHASLAKQAGVPEQGLRGNGEGFSTKQLAVLRYTDAMTKDVEVPSALFDELRKHFTEKEVVEITATVAAYNCCSRFLVALDVGETNDNRDVQTRKY